MPYLPAGKLHWTLHARAKMGFYGLSESRVKRVLRNPRRVEEGVAEKTFAVMQPTSVKKIKGSSFASAGGGSVFGGKASEDRERWSQEIWVMAQKRGRTLHIISVWRYPGVAPQRNPIPEEIMTDLQKAGLV